MFCENCGKPVPEQALFCENCGTRIERTPNQEMNSQPYMQAGQQMGMPGMGMGQPQQAPAPMAGNMQTCAPKAPMSLWRKILLGEIVAFAVLVYLFSTNIKSYVSPELVAEKFFVAMMRGDAQSAYEMMDVTESDFVNAKQFEQTVAKTGCKEIRNYKVTDIENDSGCKEVLITYREKEDSEEKYFTILLDKLPKKKWLFFDQWQVNAGNYIKHNVELSVWDGGTVTVNGVLLDDKYRTKSQDGMTYYCIPKVFDGVYNIKAENSLYETIEENVDISYDECSRQYSSSYAKVKKEVKDEVCNQAKEHWKKFMQSAIADKKEFADISDIPMVAETGDIQSNYEYLKGKFAENRDSEGQLEMGFENFEISFRYSYPYYEGEVPEATIDIEASYKGVKKERGWFTSDLYENENQGTYYGTMKYTYEGGKWLLSDMDIYGLYY